MTHHYSKATLAKRLKYGRDRRRAFQKDGLRSDGKPRALPKPCGCTFGSCMQCRKRGHKLIWSATEVKAMWKDYSSGMSRGAVEQKYGVGKKGLQDIFERRGYKLRPYKFRQARRINGAFVADPPKTAAQITEMIRGLKRLAVPEGLKKEWRLWSLAKRAVFTKRLRKRFPSTRPTGPFSTNVEPFEYGTPRAHQIVARLNLGCSSQTKVATIKPSSEGVIWCNQLFYWIKNKQGSGDGYQSGGNPKSRVFLHRMLWERHNGRLVPPKFTVIYRDGNKNNLQPENLTLRSMADCARMNQVFRRLRENPDDESLKAKARHVIERTHEGRRRRLQEREQQTLAALLNNDNQKIIKQLAA
jgi:HNH endonuclease